MSIGDNIRAARIECNMTQAELAEKVGLSQSTIALYEAGKRELTASQIVPFAHVLDTSPLFLLEGTRGGRSLPLLSSLSSRQKREKSGSESCRRILSPVPNAFLFCFILFNIWVRFAGRFAVHICTAKGTANQPASLADQVLSTVFSTGYTQGKGAFG